MKFSASLYRSLLFGLVFFIVFSIITLISDDFISITSFFPGLAGGLIAGLVIYIGTLLLTSKRKDRE